MESITIKVDNDLAKEMEKAMKPGYATKTEFIREAIRHRIEERKREDLIKEFMKFRGSAKKKTTYEENRRIREEVSKELLEELDKRFR